MNVPQLRFSGFEGDWISTSLGEISNVQTGPFGSQLHNADYVKVGTPIITVEHFGDNRIIHKNLPLVSDADKERLKKYSLALGDIVFSRVGTIDRRVIVRQEEEGWLFSGRCLRVRVNDEGTNKKYLSYYLGTKKCLNEIQSKAVGGTMPSLNTAILSSINISLPKSKEQKKIAKFFDLLVAKIEKQKEKVEKLEQIKKGMIQKVFRQELRFKNENNREFPEWRSIKLNKVLEERKEKGNERNLKVHSVAVRAGVINQITHLGRSFAAKDVSNYSVVKYGDIVYTKSPTGDFPFGIIKQSHIKEDVIVSPLYGIYEPKNFYIGYILHSYFMYKNNTNNYLYSIVQKGAKNTINITNQTFVSKNIQLPCSEVEQEKIAVLLQNTDKKIEKEKEKLMVLEEQKKGFMQMLFV
ncbi:restriction endonuclease subunit S [Planococcus sp. MERTA32b]|nr:restriction endonuclease subunit S [Planococcus sp. MER TA 32b]